MLHAADALPHLESGGDRGDLVFFGNHSADDRLYEILDEKGLLVDDWKASRA